LLAKVTFWTDSFSVTLIFEHGPGDVAQRTFSSDGKGS
jgi:hypothetical protein